MFVHNIFRKLNGPIVQFAHDRRFLSGSTTRLTKMNAGSRFLFHTCTITVAGLCVGLFTVYMIYGDPRSVNFSPAGADLIANGKQISV